MNLLEFGDEGSRSPILLHSLNSSECFISGKCDVNFIASGINLGTDYNLVLKGQCKVKKKKRQSWAIFLRINT